MQNNKRQKKKKKEVRAEGEEAERDGTKVASSLPSTTNTELSTAETGSDNNDVSLTTT